MPAREMISLKIGINPPGTYKLGQVKKLVELLKYMG